MVVAEAVVVVVGTGGICEDVPIELCAHRRNREWVRLVSESWWRVITRPRRIRDAQRIEKIFRQVVKAERRWDPPQERDACWEMISSMSIAEEGELD